MHMQSYFAAALLNPGAACPAGLFTWNGSDPGRRFDVYRNNVTSSLIQALADTFPVVQTLVGEAFFRAMARMFVQNQPPKSPLLVHYGAHFADFVAHFAPAESVPYLADVARLEMARVAAYHAADADPIASDALSLALAKPQRIPHLRVQFLPSLQVLRSPWAILSVWAAHQSHAEPDLSTLELASAEDVVVFRKALDVHVSLLPRDVAYFIQALTHGHNLGDAAALATQLTPDFDLSQALATLLRLGVISALVDSIEEGHNP